MWRCWRLKKTFLAKWYTTLVVDVSAFSDILTQSLDLLQSGYRLHHVLDHHCSNHFVVYPGLHNSGILTRLSRQYYWDVSSVYHAFTHRGPLSTAFYLYNRDQPPRIEKSNFLKSAAKDNVGSPFMKRTLGLRLNAIGLISEKVESF